MEWFIGNLGSKSAELCRLIFFYHYNYSITITCALRLSSWVGDRIGARAGIYKYLIVKYIYNLYINKGSVYSLRKWM